MAVGMPSGMASCGPICDDCAEPGVTTVKDILDGKVPTIDNSGDRIVMVGEAVRRIDQDDYRFSDGTGEIRIDIADSLNQDMPLNTCMIVSGTWGGVEVNVEAYAGCTGFMGS